MKKLLNISVIAALAILPLAANAEVPASDPGATTADAPVAANAPKYALAQSDGSDNIVATASYVKGAYNAAIKAINKVSETASNALTADGQATLTNKAIDANGTGNSITNLETDNFANGVIVTTVGAEGADTSLPTEQAVREAITTATTGMVTVDGTQTLTNKTISGAAISGGTISNATITGGTIDASSTNISNLDAGDFATGVVRDSTAGIRATANAEDDKLVTEKAVAAAIAGATTGTVTVDGTQTLTNKTIDADDNTISDLELDNFKSGVVVNSTTGIAAVGLASDTKTVTEKAVASAIENFATKTGVTTTVTNALNAATVDISGLQVANGALDGTATASVPVVATWGATASTGNVSATVDLANVTTNVTLSGDASDIAVHAGTVAYPN